MDLNIPLYDHAKKIVLEDKKKTGLFLGTGATKTRIALSLARGKILIIVPKIQRDDRNWQREVAKVQKTEPRFNPDITVLSKEDFKRDFVKLDYFDTLIVDEARKMLGVSTEVKTINKEIFPKTSKFFECLNWYVKKHNPERLYLCDANIDKTPLTVYAAATILGHKWDYFDFKRTFYSSYTLPGKYYPAYNVKKDDATKERLARAVRNLGSVGRLEDWNDVPEQTFKDDYVELTPKQVAKIKDIKLEFPDPRIQVKKIHQVENGIFIGNEFAPDETFDTKKMEKILDYADEFPQIIVVALYTKQIEQIEWYLTKHGKNVITLTGQTKAKDRAGIIQRAENSKECVFLVQSSIMYGWELKDYPCIVFVSRSYTYDDYEQALGRVQRADKIKKNIYINLITRPRYERISGRKVPFNDSDQAIHESLLNKEDFSERKYAKKRGQL